MEPFPGNVEFKIGGAWLQIIKGEVKPSSWSIQFEVRDLHREHERLRSSKIATSKMRGKPGVISYFDVKDLDGNEVRFFQVLTSDTKVTGDR